MNTHAVFNTLSLSFCTKLKATFYYHFRRKKKSLLDENSRIQKDNSSLILVNKKLIENSQTAQGNAIRLQEKLDSVYEKLSNVSLLSDQYHDNWIAAEQDSTQLREQLVSSTQKNNDLVSENQNLKEKISVLETSILKNADELEQSTSTIALKDQRIEDLLTSLELSKDEISDLNVKINQKPFLTDSTTFYNPFGASEISGAFPKEVVHFSRQKRSRLCFNSLLFSSRKKIRYMKDKKLVKLSTRYDVAKIIADRDYTATISKKTINSDNGLNLLELLPDDMSLTIKTKTIHWFFDNYYFSEFDGLTKVLLQLPRNCSAVVTFRVSDSFQNILKCFSSMIIEYKIRREQASNHLEETLDSNKNLSLHSYQCLLLPDFVKQASKP